MDSTAASPIGTDAPARRILEAGRVGRSSLVLDLAYRDAKLAAEIGAACLSWYGLLPGDADPDRIGERIDSAGSATVLPHPSPWRLDFPAESLDLAYVANPRDGAAFLEDENRLTEVLAALAPGGRAFFSVEGTGTALAGAATRAGFSEVVVQTAGLGPNSEVVAFKSGNPPAVRRLETPKPPSHRAEGYGRLGGDGLEIGAFNEPAALPVGCRVRYFDAIDAREAAALFPEIDPAQFVAVDFVGDIDRGGLGVFADGAFDFVVCNHVIEHVANPVLLLRELFRIVRRGGRVVLSAPDKRFTFDHERPVTGFAHVWDEYEGGVSEVTDDHYLEFVRHVAPHLLGGSAESLASCLRTIRGRREHAHVWDSEGFRNMVEAVLARVNLGARLEFESSGDDNRIEFFGIWMKA